MNPEMVDAEPQIQPVIRPKKPGHHMPEIVAIAGFGLAGMASLGPTNVVAQEGPLTTPTTTVEGVAPAAPTAVTYQSRNFIPRADTVNRGQHSSATPTEGSPTPTATNTPGERPTPADQREIVPLQSGTRKITDGCSQEGDTWSETTAYGEEGRFIGTTNENELPIAQGGGR